MFSVALILLLAAGSCVNSIDLIQPDSMVVQPGQSLTITCQVSGYSLTDNSYATGWIRQCEGKPMDWIFHMWGGGSLAQNDALKNKFSYSRDTSAQTVTLKGQNLQPEDTAVYYCVRTRGGGIDYWGKGTQVTVTSATSTAPTVFPLMPCDSETGGMVSLSCLVTGFTPSSLTYTWTKGATALTDFIQYPPVQKGNAYTGVSQVQVRREDWQTRTPDDPLKCVVTHPAGTAQCLFVPPKENIQLPEHLSVSAYSDENGTSFSCFAKDFAPKKYDIKWLKNEVELTNKLYEIKTLPVERLTEGGRKLYTATGVLMVPPGEWAEETTFKCQFKGKEDKTGEAYKNASVTYPKGDSHPGCPEADVVITITGPSMGEMFLNKTGKLVCRVKLSNPPADKISWQDGEGNEMVASPNTPVKEKRDTFSLSLDITYDEWSKGLKRYCVVEHTDLLEPLKKLYERHSGGQTQRPSVFMQPAIEHTRKGMVTLTCFVKDFFPKEVLVSWLVDDEAANSETFNFHTTEPVKSKGSYFAYGQLSLSLEQWEKNDVVYSCVVHHESLTNATKAIVRSIGSRTFEKTNLVNLNMNIPETCKA